MNYRIEDEPELTVFVDIKAEQSRRPTRYSLGKLLSWLVSNARSTSAAIEDMSANIDRLASELNALSGAKERTSRYDSAMRQMGSQIHSLEEKVTGIDARLDEIMAYLDSLVVRGRQEERDIDHHSFHREFTSLVNQDVGTLVEIIGKRREFSPRDCAWLTGKICWNLFSQPQVQGAELLDLAAEEPAEVRERMQALLVAVEHLRTRISDYQNQHWDFSFQPGVPIDPSYQEKWSAYPAGDLVEFVVVPSYVIDGYSLLSMQRVFASADGATAADQGTADTADAIAADPQTDTEDS